MQSALRAEMCLAQQTAPIPVTNGPLLPVVPTAVKGRCKPIVATANCTSVIEIELSIPGHELSRRFPG